MTEVENVAGPRQVGRPWHVYYVVRGPDGQREVPWPHNPVVWRNLSSLCTEIGQTMLTRMRAGMAAGEEIVGVRIAAAWEPYTACSAPVQATEGKES
jgi:hypothetical protein